ncbi:uncharacterized protein LOC118456616 [Anopheles albimanus]|uniref:Gustatory receptor n=1 Tax=Anopheles albimanus TaxID=7167 RepID=A0A182FRY7_ANOAL|nr:uncharacterized protein LOC118456616 [Anopheles albimanus]
MKKLVVTFRKCSNVYDVLNMHLSLMTFLGELFIVGNHRTGSLHVSSKGLGLFVLQLLSLILLAIGGQLAHSLLEETNATYLHYGMSLLITSTGAYAVVVTICNARAGKIIWHILECFDEFDRKMDRLSAPVDHRAQKLTLYHASTVAMLGCVSSNAAFFFAIVLTYSNVILQAIVFVEVSLFVVVVFSSLAQIVMLSFLAYGRFRHLRRFFDIHFLPWQPASSLLRELNKVNLYQRRTHSALFHSVLQMFDDLHRALKLINKVYLVQLVLISSALLPSPTFALYATYRSFVTENYELRYMIATIAVSSLLYLFSFFVLIFISTGISYEVDRLVRQFHMFTNMYHVEFRRFVEESAVCIKTHFLPLHMGPIELNWKLAFSMLGWMVSYLVILIQFDASDVGLPELQSQCNSTD